MSLHVVKKPRAQQDLIEHFSFIARDKPAPAERFLKVAEESIQRLADHPGIGRVWETSLSHLSGIRIYPMPSRFRNYLIFYRLHNAALEVLTILHGGRDLGRIVDSLRLD